MGARIVISLDERIVSEVPLTRDVMMVGRHPDCDVVIEHPAISGRHMLLRVVNHTVYAEDLASTNGTRVNGLTAHHQVIHHLDVIEVGRHKLHFFDDSLLAGKVGGLENTVLTDFERTMLSEHAPLPARPRPMRDESLDRTVAMPRDPDLQPRMGPIAESVQTTGEPPSATLQLKVVAGSGQGQTIGLQRANTMIGTPGAETALVVRRGDAYYLARFSGNRAPRLNHRELGPGTHRIAPQDVIDVGGSSFEVIPAN